jgi:hypothetical protein
MSFWTKEGDKIVGTKSSKATLDFPIDFTNWLDTDTYSSHTITNTGNINIVSSTVIGSMIVPLIGGGFINELAKFTIRIVSTGGRIDEFSFYLRIT